MRKSILRVTLAAVIVAQTSVASFQNTANAADDQLTAQNVLESIKRGRNYIVSQQRPDGSWESSINRAYPTGVTSLNLLALINAGLTADDPAIARGLKWLRAVKEPSPGRTYEISLMIMVLTAAKEGTRDNLRIFNLVQKLENNQLKNGEDAGGWGYGGASGGSDRSNTQYAILGLRDAAYHGIPVERKTWKLARDHWLASQHSDGGWGYSKMTRKTSYGSMTVAGIASLVITSTFLNDNEEVDEQGNPLCCLPPEPNEPMERAIRWMARNFSVNSNPGGSQSWLYYLYGLERAGRLSGRRFFGTHDWYREGARALLNKQNKRNGSWKGMGVGEDNEVVGTPLSLLFLSKGLAPVLINKLKLGPRDPDNTDLVIGELWNRHPKDVSNLVEHISTLPKWPKLLSWQTFDFDKAVENNGLQEMLQAPILFVTSENDLSELMSDQHITLLQNYFTQGGFLFVSRGCKSESFDQGMHQLVK
ncbi:MAG: terpene cyclase/mutase family protein, partial [Planctomycetaceae bacterium]|nr:terpene cyclase/mutase family protein [Planctomycetaceae bacterium]